MKIRNNQNKIYLALLLGLLHMPLMAQSPVSGFTGTCRISPLASHLQPVNNSGDDETLYLSGDYGDSDIAFSSVSGNIVAYYGNSRVDADNLILDRQKNILTGENQQILYASDSAVLQTSTFTGYLTDKNYEGKDLTYYLKDAEAQGKAKYGIRRQNDQKTDFEKVTYSTCPVDTEVWQLTADELLLDHEAGRGVAKNAVMKVFSVPMLYTPYISFPIDNRRQSGFLFPEVTYDSTGGFSLRAPYYLNIAPNFDMTLTPGFYTKRGLVLGGEARYLNTWQSSILRAEILPNDRVFRRSETLRIDEAIENEEPYGKRRSNTRWSVYYQQSMNFNSNLSGNILFQQVSDDQYAKDIQDSIGLLTKTNLERRAEFSYVTDNWEAILNFQHFQVLDRDVIPDNPYARMPQFLFNGEWWTDNGIYYGINAEAVHFTTRVTERDPFRPKSATRYDLMPYVGFRAENSWGFFEPRITYRYTYYDLKYERFSHAYEEINEINRDKDKYLSRSLPIISIDSGIVLERNMSFNNFFGGGNFIQTLEPRLFYLYVPYKSQQDIPRFDTGTVTPSFDNLFISNQFTGADRQSNANQLTTALTTRLLGEDDGIEYFSLSAGQTYYFDEPRITLNNDLRTRRECHKLRREGEENLTGCGTHPMRSEWFLENTIRLTSDFESRISWQWSPDIRKTTRLAMDLRYQPEPRKIFNIGHRYTRDRNGDLDDITHQLDISSFWEVNNNWAFVGRYNYSLEEHRFNDSYLGVEYLDCCIATRVAVRYYREDNNLANNKKEWKAYLQFELKGLGNFGQDTNQFWVDTIPNYIPRSLGGTTRSL